MPITNTKVTAFIVWSAGQVASGITLGYPSKVRAVAPQRTKRT